jgi:TolB-like protein
MKKIIILMATLISFTSLNALSTTINGVKYESVPFQSVNEAGRINQLVANLGKQLTQNRNFKNISNNKIAITSFVNLNDFENVGVVGNIISENLIHELQVRGFKVIDFKTMDAIKVQQKGDFIFSRNAEKLRKKYDINLVLTGTCTSYKRGVVVNARIINMKDHSVVSTAQIWIEKRLLNKINGTNKIIEFNYVEKQVVPQVKKHMVELTD